LSYERSTYEPKAHPDELVSWWERDLPGRDSIYLPFKVLVKARQERGGLTTLKFILAREEGQPSAREFEVTLPTDPDVWPDLPSTAQLVTPGKTPPYGFLFLKMEWAKRKQLDIQALAESLGGNQKWPPAGFGRPEADRDLERVLQAMRNSSVRPKLLKALDDIMAQGAGAE
jgi:hypothetical protein